ncbi:hypothetical protein F4780DRAFT_766587 [Xylariomycetidae sp. FL0641]|nr:hypothetical protein F4780DRAFT_766587 [Xylariomycetidae sp. FL0641]
MADKSLLDRLNALKPTSVSLDSPSQFTPASTIEHAKPPSKEDGLTERLRILRSQASATETPSTSAPKAHQTEDEQRGKHEANAPSSGLRTAQPQPGRQTGIANAPELTATDAAADDVDPLLHTDDQTLEELLADLGSDQQWLDEVAAEEEEHRRVMALLDELGKPSSTTADPGQGAATEDDGNSDNDLDDSGSSDDDDDDDDDDSEEGGVKTHEVDAVLARTMDAVELEKANPPPADAADSAARTERPITPSPALPGVPSALQDPPSPGASSRSSVSPSSDADFAAAIAARMAKLQVATAKPRAPPRELPSVPDTAVDALGLPIAPSFAPRDRPVRRRRDDDEDMRTWCTVCREDGALRCRGCDGDAYCARCWEEAHVGPDAYYERRGHRREHLVKGR